jgi:methyl-accepting chemotaxis protein
VKIGNLKIGIRLGIGFGMLIVMMLSMILIAIMRFVDVGEINNRIIEKEWVKAELTNTINATTRANARRTMELLITADKTQVAKVNERIEANKKTISDALATLDQLIYLPEGKALLGRLKEARSKYVSSFSKVAKLLDDGKKDEAISTMNSETLPALDAMQEPINALTDLQKKIVAASSDEVRQHINTARALLISLGVLGLLVGISFAYWITRSITRPVNQALRIARTVASGDLSSHIEVLTTDECGQLLQALQDMNDSLVDIVHKVRGGADAMGVSTSQIAAGNLDLSSRTEEQASALEETAASMEELSSTVTQNADNAKQANQLAQSASSVAIKGGEVVAQVVNTMKGINDSSKRIFDIISVIDGIAFQTNILALNAAVEAARAGDQGRGFAVVASEVRSLAGRSANAAKEIKTLINDSVERVEQGTALVDQAGTTMTEVVSSIRRVTDLMGEISAASSEQSQGVAQIGEAVAQIDLVTQQNAALVEEMAAAASSLKSQAQDLVGAVAVFKLAQGQGGFASSSHHVRLL